MTAAHRLVTAVLIGAAAPALAVPAPAPAPAPTSIPEPGDAGLLLLGAVGVAAGRWMHARRARAAKRDDPQD